MYVKNLLLWFWVVSTWGHVYTFYSFIFTCFFTMAWEATVEIRNHCVYSIFLMVNGPWPWVYGIWSVFCFASSFFFFDRHNQVGKAGILKCFNVSTNGSNWLPRPFPRRRWPGQELRPTKQQHLGGKWRCSTQFLDCVPQKICNSVWWHKQCYCETWWNMSIYYLCSI